MRIVVKIIAVLLSIVLAVAMFAAQAGTHVLFALDDATRRSSLESVFNQVLFTDMLKTMEHTAEHTDESGTVVPATTLYDAVSEVFAQAGFDRETSDKMLNSTSMRTVFYEIIFGAYIGVMNNNEENFVDSAELGVLIDMNLDGIMEASGQETNEDQKALLQIFMTMLLSELTEKITFTRFSDNAEFKKYYTSAQKLLATRNRYTLISIILVMLLLLFLFRWSILKGLRWAGFATFFAGGAVYLFGSGTVNLSKFLPSFSIADIAGSFAPIAQVLIDYIKDLLASFGVKGMLIGVAAILLSALQLLTKKKKNKNKATVIIKN